MHMVRVSTKQIAVGIKELEKVVLLKRHDVLNIFAVRREDGTIREGTHNDTEGKAFLSSLLICIRNNPL